MFGFSFTEILVVAVVALIAFGPERLPKVLSQLGKLTGELKKTSDSLRKEFYNASFIPSDEISTINKETKNLSVSKGNKKEAVQDLPEQEHLIHINDPVKTEKTDSIKKTSEEPDKEQ